MVPPLTFLWDDPNSQTTQTAIGLSPGTYSVTATDAAGNTRTMSVNVDFNPANVITIFNSPPITGNVTWTGIVDLIGEVIVERGGVLTINCANVFFSPDIVTEFDIDYMRSRITVKEGGVLIIDNSYLGGGLLTQTPFDGIEVWGDPNQPQTTGLSGAQGLVIIRNNSEIANANIAIQCERTPLQNATFLPTFGGVIQASNSTFRNNNLTIFARNYIGNSSSFYLNCNFIYDGGSTYTYSPTSSFQEMEFIHLDNINGVNFLGNNLFRSNTVDFSDPNDRGTAINSFDSEYKVLGAEFRDLNRGINASASNSIMALDIRNNEFNNVARGIFIKGIDYSKIEDNVFNITPNLNPQPYGLYMLETTGYSIKNNVFNGIDPTIGLYIENTAGHNAFATNMFNLNIFNGLEFGSFANGTNGKQFDGSKGLKVKCNSYNNTKWSLLTTVAPGISIQQGSSLTNSSPAGNTFTTSCIALWGQLFNLAASGPSTNSYDYWYHSSPVQYVPDGNCVTSGFVFPMNSNQAFTINSCSTLTGGGGGGGSSSSTKQAILDNNIAIGDLEIMLDNGNSTGLVSMIKQKSLSDIDIQKLLKDSDPVSNNVLITMAKSNYDDKTIRKSLIFASPLNDEVLYTLIKRDTPILSSELEKILLKNIPIHQEIINLLSTDVLSHKDLDKIIDKQNLALSIGLSNLPNQTQTIEAQISDLKAENQLLNNELIRIELHNETKLSRFSEIISILDNQNSGFAETKAIQAACRKRDFGLAIQKIESLEAKGTELEFCNMQRALITIDGMPNKLMSIQTDPLLNASIKDVANNKELAGCTNACNILERVFQIPVNEVFVYPVLPNSLRIIEEENNTIQEEVTLINDFELKNYPNPFSKYTTIEAMIPFTQEKTYLIIRNIIGSNVLKVELLPGKNKINFNGSNLKNGVYFYSIETNKIKHLVKKMILSK